RTAGLAAQVQLAPPTRQPKVQNAYQSPRSNRGQPVEAPHLGGSDRQRMPTRVLAQRFEVDRLDQAGKIALGRLPAELLQHQPAYFLNAGDALAVGDLAPDLHRPQDDAVGGSREA